MKVAELLGEKERIQLLLNMGGNYSLRYEPESVWERQKKQREMAQTFERDKSFLDYLDRINDCLKESDATTYVEVEGRRITVATAVMYLKEIKKSGNGQPIGMFGRPVWDCELDYFTNQRMQFLNRCREAAGYLLNNIEEECKPIDPNHLQGKEREYEEKMVSYYISLKKAVAISNAITEVSSKQLSEIRAFRDSYMEKLRGIEQELPFY